LGEEVTLFSLKKKKHLIERQKKKNYRTILRGEGKKNLTIMGLLVCEYSLSGAFLFSNHLGSASHN